MLMCGGGGLGGGWLEVVVVGVGSESKKELGDNETGESRRHCLSGNQINGPGPGVTGVSRRCEGRRGLKGAVASGAGCVCELGLEEKTVGGEVAVVVGVLSVLGVYASGQRELSSEVREVEGRRQFAWRLRVLLGLELGTSDSTGQAGRQKGRLVHTAGQRHSRGVQGERVRRGKGGPGRA